MTDSERKDDTSLADEGDLPEPLVKWERVCAMAIGAICGGAGGYAVYERSNQAGAVMLLVLAAVFLLIGVQGTPLIKFGSSTGSLELERRRRRRVEQALEQASEEGSTEKAEGIVEGVRIVAPDLVPKSFEDYKNYENSVADALTDMGYEILREPRHPQIRADMAIVKNGRSVYAELKYSSRRIPPEIVRQAIGMSAITSAPVLLIASSPLTSSAQDLIARSGILVDFAQWRGERDNPELAATLERLFLVGNPNKTSTVEGG